MKERNIQIFVIGKPSIKNLPKTEAKIFYSALLSAAAEYYSNIDENASVKAENTKTAG